jgi:DNA-binding Xre family transcriptional regulator
MTRTGEFLAKKSINRASISRKTGISTARLSELSNKESARLTAEELYLIALAIGVNPGDLLEYVCSHVALEKE